MDGRIGDRDSSVLSETMVDSQSSKNPNPLMAEAARDVRKKRPHLFQRPGRVNRSHPTDDAGGMQAFRNL